MDYHLKPISRVCAGTGEELEPGTTCHSVLIEKEGELVRLDFSEEGWTGWDQPAVGLWECIVPKPAPVKKQTIDAAALMDYFDQLTEDANPAREKFRYVLSLLLLQKRRLKLDGSRYDEDVEYLQLTGTHGEGNYEVRDFQLEEAEMHQLQEDLNGHLMQEWVTSE